MEMFWGPILMVQDTAPANQTAGIVLCAVLVPCMLAGVIRPRWWSITISALAAVAWLICGCIGIGINC